jgi:hypothetical protein
MCRTAPHFLRLALRQPVDSHEDVMKPAAAKLT